MKEDNNINSSTECTNVIILDKNKVKIFTLYIHILYLHLILHDI